MNNYHLEIENVGFGIYLIIFQKYIPYIGVNALLGMISSNPKAASGKTRGRMMLRPGFTPMISSQEFLVRQNMLPMLPLTCRH